MLHPIILISKKEIMDNIRNKWMIIVSIIFAALVLVSSYFGSLGNQGWQDIGGTISSMMAFVLLLVPIIALILAYAALIGEIERGSMSSLLTLPTTRLEILLGKFFGLSTIIAITILIGFGIAGIVIGVNVEGVNFVDYLVFIGSTILFGLVFISVAIFFSSLFRRRTSAIGGAIFIWFFFNMILPVILAGILFSSVGFESVFTGNFSIPEWYYGVQLINPITVYQTLIGLTVGPVATTIEQTVTTTYPDYYSSGLMILILGLWVILFQLFAYIRFRTIDI